jgi:Icc-related predicted phosphoesterase
LPHGQRTGGSNARSEGQDVHDGRASSYGVLMRVNVVSDVHGSTNALARAGDGADALFCLGDLILFIDYADHSQGIFAELFGAEQARALIALRTARRFDEATALSRRLRDGLGGDPAKQVEAAVARQYAELFAALPEPAYLTYGNVDIPHMWQEHLRPRHTVLDGERIELDGWTFGFVGGGLRSPYRTPNELNDDVYAAKLAAVGTVDVLCTHIPPAIPQLLYDTVARRLERGSEDLLKLIVDTKPRYLLFGHVHQPLVSRTRIGTTECVNVGHFRATKTPYVLDW